MNELILVLGSQPAGDRSRAVGRAAVGCHYFPPGPQLPPQPPSFTAHWPVPNYTAILVM